MLEQLYDIKEIHDFLKSSGASRLENEDGVIAPAARGGTGEFWRFPTHWRHAEFIVIRLGETYPDDPPTFFLPAEQCGELVPHVAISGDICTVDRTFTVNPDKPLVVLKGCLAVASGILDRDWTDEEISVNINSELAPYWNFLADKTLLFFRTDLACPVLEITGSKAGRNIFEARPSVTEKYKPSAQLALVTELSEHETVPFLRSPASFLRSSEPFLRSVDAFAARVSERNSVLKIFDLIIVIIAKLGDQECILAGFVPQPITAKRKSGPQLRDAILGVLAHKKIEAWRAEDISTRRLLRRTTGPHFKEKRLDQRVAVIGCGSLGSFVADGLGRSGIRNFFLCDPDIFTPGNLLRHLLPKGLFYFNKAASVQAFLSDRLPDAVIQSCMQDIRLQESISALSTFRPDLVLLATGDTNTDLTMSRLLPAICNAALAFSWADPHLAAGHLIYQSAGTPSILRDLHSEATGEYLHSLADKSIGPLKESGCQNSYSPYSGLEMQQFATAVTTKLIDWLDEPPSENQVLRLPRHDPWERPE